MNTIKLESKGFRFSEFADRVGFEWLQSYATSIVVRRYAKTNKSLHKGYDGNEVVSLSITVWDKTDKDLDRLRESDEFKALGFFKKALAVSFMLAKNEFSHKLSFKVSYPTGKNAKGQVHPFSVFNFGAALHEAKTAYEYKDNLSKTKKSTIRKKVVADMEAAMKTKGDAPHTANSLVETVGRIMLINLIDKVDAFDKLKDDTVLAMSEQSQSKTDTHGKNYQVDRLFIEAGFLVNLVNYFGENVNLFRDIDRDESAKQGKLVAYKDQNGEDILSLRLGKTEVIEVPVIDNTPSEIDQRNPDDLPF